MRRPAHGEGHDLGDVLGDQRRDALVDLGRAVLVAREADERELGLHRAGRDLGDAHGLPEQLAAQGAVHGALGVLGGRVARAAVVDLEAGDRGDRDDVAVARVDQQGQQALGDAQGPEDVGLPHPAPLLLVGLDHLLGALGAAGVVHQAAQRALRGDQVAHAVDERGHRVRVGDVEGQRGAADLLGDLGEALHPACAEDGVPAVGGEGAGGGGADARAGAGDDGEGTVGSRCRRAHAPHLRSVRHVVLGEPARARRT